MRTGHLPAAALLIATSCSGSGPKSATVETRSGGPPQQTLALNITSVDTTFTTRDHFMAAIEMQISGEPFAEAMGRDLAGFSRDYSCQIGSCDPNSYFDPALNGGVVGGPIGRVDLAGFSSAVESYEYSKQPMNNIAFESGAGTSLLFGPVVNPNGMTGTTALSGFRSWVQHLAGASNATRRFVSLGGTANNPLGWPGLWPTLQPFSSWDPSIQVTNASTGCSISSDDDPGASGSLKCDDYECDYNGLHLPNRGVQVTMTVDPGSSGWAGWKEALWTLNYLQVMHDSAENPVNTVPDAQLGLVGIPGNSVVGHGGPGNSTLAGTFLGSSDIEGFQAGNFLQILDNQAALWLSQLTTTDGATLGGFATLSDALAYSASAQLRWFPGSIAVTEASDDSGFPRPAGYSVASPDSHLLDLAGLLGAYSSVYSLTDQANTEVGGSQPVLAYFDGDPFPVQNQIPSGAATLHDRALSMIRVLVVNIDRLHLDPTTNIFVDDVALAHGNVSRGSVLSGDVAAYTLLALRTARRALDSALTLYSNTKPDSEGVPTSLDAFPLSTGMPYGARLDDLIDALAGFFYDKLTVADGHAFSSWNVGAGSPGDTGQSLDAHTAAIRGLLVAYLATGQTKFRDRAASVFGRLEGAFYDSSARAYRTVALDRSSQLTFTARRFALLQGALRDTYELIALLPGNAAMATVIEDRIGRLNKLVLNGWDDRDQDQEICWPNECAQTRASSDGGLPLALGGLQMAERVLSGESGSVGDAFDAGTRVVATDREHDCVPEISAVGLPAALANAITFTLTPWTIAQEKTCNE